MSFKDAFNSLLKLKERPMTLTRPDVHTGIALGVSFSNYFRNSESVEQVVVEGREFVISKEQLTSDYIPILIGDVLTDSELGDLSITFVSEMVSIGGEIIGYRVRTS